MKNKKNVLLIIFLIVLLFLFIFAIFNYSSSQYEETARPKIKAKDLQSLVALLIKQQEKFTGSVNVRYIDPGSLDKAEITIQNTTVYDDSIGATENKMIAERKGQTWVITSNKSRWKCARDYFFNSWTIGTCP